MSVVILAYRGFGHVHELILRGRVLSLKTITPARDPEIYLDVIRAHPGRILAAFIRDVTEDVRDKAVATIIDEAKSAGVQARQQNMRNASGCCSLALECGGLPPL